MIQIKSNQINNIYESLKYAKVAQYGYGLVYTKQKLLSWVDV